MPSPEYEKLVALVYDWLNDDKEYLWECSLKDGSPDYIKKAFERLKEIHNEFQDEFSISDA